MILLARESGLRLGNWMLGVSSALLAAGVTGTEAEQEIFLDEMLMSIKCGSLFGHPYSRVAAGYISQHTPVWIPVPSALTCF